MYDAILHVGEARARVGWVGDPVAGMGRDWLGRPGLWFIRLSRSKIIIIIIIIAGKASSEFTVLL
jgi:hypothetical protein